VISAADALCASQAFQHNFKLFVTQRCALCQKYLVSLKSPYRHSLLAAVMPPSHWSALITPKTKLLRIWVRGSRRPVEWSSVSYPLYTASLVSVMSDKAGTMSWWSGTWPRVLANYSPSEWLAHISTGTSSLIWVVLYHLKAWYNF
jgi:hypothetical protein